MGTATLELTAYCGIYCGDCIHYKNNHSQLAEDLKKELAKVKFEKYAAIKSSFGDDFKHYKEFLTVLKALEKHYCSKPCRVGNGCSSTPCEIMKCCLEKGYTGCWECNEVNDCNKFDFLEPRCGDMPKNNLKKIKRLGLANWAEHREKFYIWL